MKKKEYLGLFVIFCGFIIFAWIFRNKPFFWDKDIVDSKQASWFLANSFKLLLPDNLDPGHPPFVSYIMAIGWKIFGKKLIVSHLIFLPFTLGFIYQSYILISKFAERDRLIILLLLLIDTSILTQMIVVSSDLVLMFFLLLSINGLIQKRRILLMLGIMGLSIVNMRGMLVCFGIFVSDLILNVKRDQIKRTAIDMLYYLPGAILALTFLVFHYKNKGWVAYHEGSPWAGCYERVGIQGMIRNVIIIAWRVMDFGRIIYFLIAIVIFIMVRKKQLDLPKVNKSLFVFTSILFIVLVPSMIVSKNLLGHRYLIPFTFIISLLLLLFISKFKKKRELYYAIIFAFMLSGSFWVYPDRIAQGWDATMAHVPYHVLHKKMLSFIDMESIDMKEIGTVTPNLSTMEHVYLNKDDRSFAEKDFERNNYILYSNIFNDFTDEELVLLKNEWKSMQEFSKCGIQMILYKK